jgi:hypothetical protein
MPKKNKPPAWAALLVLGLCMIFVLNIGSFIRLITPYVGMYIQHTQDTMQDAAKKK